MKNCSNCGKNILDNMVRCPYCGATQKNVQKIPEETLENDILKAAERMDKKEKNILLKILGSVLGIVYIYWAISSLDYFNYYAVSYKIAGALLFIVCLGNAGVMLYTAFRYQKNNIRQMVYAILGGTALKSILNIVIIQWSNRYDYWHASLSDYFPVIVIWCMAGIWIVLLRRMNKKASETEDGAAV